VRLGGGGQAGWACLLAPGGEAHEHSRVGNTAREGGGMDDAAGREERPVVREGGSGSQWRGREGVAGDRCFV